MSLDTWMENARATVPMRLARRLMLTNRWKKGRGGRPGGSRPRQMRLDLEALEDRIVLTGTVTTVTSFPDPSIFGQSVTLDATVVTSQGSLVTVGTVTFSIGNVSSGPVSLGTNGLASFSDSTFSPG